MDYQLFELARREVIIAGWTNLVLSILLATSIVIMWIMRNRFVASASLQESKYNTELDYTAENWTIAAWATSVLCGVLFLIAIQCAVDSFAMKNPITRVKSE